jgi:hypothetical protein
MKSQKKEALAHPGAVTPWKKKKKKVPAKNSKALAR